MERISRRLNAKKGDGDEEIEPQAQLSDVLSPGQIRILRTGTPDEKRSLLNSFDDEKQDDIVIAMRQPLRNQLLPVANTGTALGR